jgi:hypothetical protein
MIPDVQREALVALAEVWALSPDVRLGQLLAHLGVLGEDHLGRGLGSIEDDELIAILYRHGRSWRLGRKTHLIRRSMGLQAPHGVPEVRHL